MSVGDTAAEIQLEIKQGGFRQTDFKISYDLAVGAMKVAGGLSEGSKVAKKWTGNASVRGRGT